MYIVYTGEKHNEKININISKFPFDSGSSLFIDFRCCVSYLYKHFWIQWALEYLMSTLFTLVLFAFILFILSYFCRIIHVYVLYFSWFLLLSSVCLVKYRERFRLWKNSKKVVAAWREMICEFFVGPTLNGLTLGLQCLHNLKFALGGNWTWDLAFTQERYFPSELGWQIP
jgi:hypothetical protein